jgi:CBS domain containing-hemolysin-like protein
MIVIKLRLEIFFASGVWIVCHKVFFGSAFAYVSFRDSEHAQARKSGAN